MKRLLLSGKMCVGKDYVAKQLGFQILGFADPLYKICEFYFGTHDKKVDGVRKFLQDVGQWGRGTVDPNYPLTTERALFVDKMRSDGYSITRMGNAWHWMEYGKDSDFWIHILMDRIHSRSDNDRIAVTNARFDNEVERLKTEGFDHYHVLCTDENYVRRFKDVMGLWMHDPETEAMLNNISEHMAKKLDEIMPEDRVIWNDHPNQMPAGKKYVTLEQMKERI